MKSRNSLIYILATIALIAGMALPAFGDDGNASDQGADSNAILNQTKTKLDQSAPGSNSTPGAEVVDQLITNNELRAISGSLSKWSIASTFDYLGGTITSPLSQDRPDISASSGTTTKSDLDGAISVKYNIDGKNSLMAGIGLRWIAPLTLGGPSNYDGTTFDVMNPYLQYQRVYKFLGIQAVTQIQDMQWTQADQTAVGYANQLSVDQENMYAIPHSKFSIGASTWAQYQWFNKSGSYGAASDPNFIADVATVQSVYAFGIDPVIEYQISPKVNLRTLASLWTYEHYGSQAAGALIHDNIYQSIGVGISITRDIFLYPNLQFLPGDFAANETNVGVTATINVF